MKKALITGITGQDGSYLAEYLLALGYEVFGIIRRHSVVEQQTTRIDHIADKIKLFYGELEDKSSIDKVIKQVMPDEIYNLAAQSHVKISFDTPKYTIETNAIGVLNLLESMKELCPTAHFYQASSSEMFGNQFDEDKFQRETTHMCPASPYACGKLCAYNLCRVYRESYKLFICNGILFNHESPRRGLNFVTAKIIKGALMIKYGLQKELVLGNLDAYRDWGHAKDYIKCMHRMLNTEQPDDYIVSSMETHSVREFCDVVFTKLGMNYKNYVKQDKKFMRDNELTYLKGDSSKFRKKFNWIPEFNFNGLVDDMMSHWNNLIMKENNIKNSLA